MINLNLFILALKTTWVRKLFRTEGKWDNILFSTNQEKLFNFGNGYISYIKENVVKNKFWKDVFHAWNTFIDKRRKLYMGTFFVFSTVDEQNYKNRKQTSIL